MQPDSAMTRWMLRGWAANFEALRTRPPQDIVNRLFAGLRTVLPIALFLFVPVLAAALKVLYIRSRVLYVDHLIFGLQFQSAMFLTLALAWFVARMLTLSFFWSLVIYVIVWLLMLTAYLPMALRRVYAQSRSVTALKTALVSVAYFTLPQPVMGAAILLVVFRL